jgi:high-affinity iron transporter
VACLIIGAGMIGAFYSLKKDAWSKSENIWEGAFGIVASIIISLMGAALLRVSKLQDKWRVKLARALESKDSTQDRSKRRFLPTSRRIKRFCEKYALFMLPLLTVLREGLEAMIFIGGVGVGQPASAFPIPVITGLTAGSLIGVAIYK